MGKPDFPPQFEAEKALYAPLGAFSPLWLAFGGAAVAGAAFYWMTRWREATNIEALMVLPAQAAEAAAEVAGAAVQVAEAAAEAVAEEVIEPLVEALPEPVEEIIAAVAPEPAALSEPDDLTRMVGIGPKVAAALAERGVTRFEQIAAWSAEDVAEADKALKLMGRIEREKWLAQAKRLAAQA